MSLNVNQTLIDIDSELFWKRLSEQWAELYPKMLSGDPNTLDHIQSLLTPELREHLELEFSFNEINRQALPRFKSYIELYISPKMLKDNLPYMSTLYEKRITLPGLITACYKAYHYHDEAIKDIEYENDFVVKYTDFGVQCTFGYNENKPILNLIIMIKDPVSKKLLKKTKVDFKSEKGPGSREIWLPEKYNAVSMMLLNIIGEYHMINHIGYIEILPEEEAKGEFYELLDIRKELEIVLKHYNYKHCNYCGHNELQVKLLQCTRCKKIYYCSKVCQFGDWLNHKLICNTDAYLQKKTKK